MVECKGCGREVNATLATGHLGLGGWDIYCPACANDQIKKELARVYGEIPDDLKLEARRTA